MTGYAGNRYTLAQTCEGVYTLRHEQTGELLHGQVGPEREAKELYLAWSGLEERRGKAVVLDVGMGAGAQTLALLGLFRSGNGPEQIEVHSFDLEKEGLRALQSHRAFFPQADAASDFLAAAAGSDAYEEEHGGRNFRWRFHGGDFRDALPSSGVTGVTEIFYDFFSSQNFPELWTVSLFELLLARSDPAGARFITYSTATCVRAALLAAGWNVGIGPCSGMRTPCIVAANRRELVTQPLGQDWLRLFARSGKQFTEAEAPEQLGELVRRVNAHPQFLPEAALAFAGAGK